MSKLIVDNNNENICQAIQDFFHDRKGHTVHTTVDPLVAPVIVCEHHPNLALLDTMMTGIDGMLKQLREIKLGRKAIMITAEDDEDIGQEAMERGAVDYVTKPPDLSNLDTQPTFQLIS